VFLARPELPWDSRAVIDALRGEGEAVADVESLIERLAARAKPGDRVVFMSNGGFENAQQRLLTRLAAVV
jgi:UDP-N-acetylmuramate: L-alanyl-gamma-D-glutamyl-meso-diaminopimelate ligase